MSALQYIERIQQVYIAYYARPADPEGLSYWSSRLDATDGDLSAIIDAFGRSDEYSNRFGDESVEGLIRKIYQSSFGRDPGAEGLAFYSKRLESGEASLADITLQVLDGASGADKSIIENKRQVANAFVDSVVVKGRVYAGEGAIDEAVLLLSAVTDEPNSVHDQTNNALVLVQRLMTDYHIDSAGYDEPGYQTRTQTDSNMDGLIDSASATMYDDIGNVVRREADYNGDGSLNYIEQINYDENGTKSVHSSTIDEFGIHSNTHTVVYNSQGKIVNETRDDDGDGVIDLAVVYSYDHLGSLILTEGQAGDHNYTTANIYTYDDAGNPLIFERSVDGVTVSIERRGYNEQGDVIFKNITQDNDGDGLADYTVAFEYEYDSFENLIRETYFYNTDGQKDTIYEYDAQKNQTLKAIDFNGDVSRKELYLTEFDDHGNAIKYQQQLGETVEIVIFTTYDDQDRNILSESYLYGDLSAGPSSTSKAVYDEHGTRISYELDSDGDGNADNIFLIQNMYNENVLITRSESSAKHTYDGDVTGAITYYGYDDYENIILQENDTEKDGVIDNRKTFTYDSDNNLLSYSEDRSGDGTPDHVVVYDYDSSGNVILIGVSGSDDLAVHL